MKMLLTGVQSPLEKEAPSALQRRKEGGCALEPFSRLMGEIMQGKCPQAQIKSNIYEETESNCDYFS